MKSPLVNLILRTLVYLVCSGEAETGGGILSGGK